MAKDSWSSGTKQRALPFGIIFTSKTLAGERELAINSSGFSEYSIISTFSPPNSLITAITLVPR